VLTTTSIATIQVISIVTGHVLGVFSARDRAVRLFPRTRAVSVPRSLQSLAVIGQLPIIVLMVGRTIGGLSLLFQG
jgi:ABC-type anion transport system duplicated permease subunit